MASQRTTNRPTKMMLRLLLLAISLYISRGPLACLMVSARAAGPSGFGGGWWSCGARSEGGTRIEPGSLSVGQSWRDPPEVRRGRSSSAAKNATALEPERASDQVVRERLQPNVVVHLRTRVVVAAGVLNFVLGGSQGLL